MSSSIKNTADRKGALSAPAAAEYLDTTVRTLAKWRYLGEGPVREDWPQGRLPPWDAGGVSPRSRGVDDREAVTGRRRATTRLESGEHSIDRNTPKPRMIGGREVIALTWSVRLHNGRLIRGKRTQGRNAAEVRRRAKATAAQLLSSNGHRSPWSATTPIEKFLDTVVTEEIDEARLRSASRQQYHRVVRLLRKKLAGHSISSVWQYDVLVDALYAISAENGAEAGRQSRSVLGKYVGQPLKRHRLTDRNPLDGADLDFARHAPAADPDKPKRGGRALSVDEQERVVTHLLALDPAAGVATRTRGRWD